MHLNTRHPFGNKDVSVLSISPPIDCTNQTEVRFYCIDQARHPKGLFVLLPQSVLFKIKVVHWELASEFGGCCFHWRYSEVLENLATKLYSESGENECFLSPVTFDKGPFATLESVYSMGTETWDKMKAT